MLKHLTLALAALASCATAHAHEHPQISTDPFYAIENPLRPGAKAPYCEAQAETADGCTFHSVAGARYSAHLEAAKGATWVANTPDTGTLGIKTADKPALVDGKTYQVIDITPNPMKNADTTVTFDKLVEGESGPKVVERRRINVMVHPG